MKSTIKDLPILDLRNIPIEDIKKINCVENVRTVVLSTQNADTFMDVQRINVRSHLIIKEDEILSIGQIEFNDEYLNEFQEGSKLVLLGHALIDGFNKDLFLRKLKSIRVYGQIIYSNKRCTGVALSRLERLQGQLLPMSPNSLRLIGDTKLDLKLLKEINLKPVVSIGPITVASEVTSKIIINNIKSLVQIGEIIGNEEAVCTLMSLCKVRHGPYRIV